ncbi:hypothetical protein [Halotia branconii]|uniref:Uncharacterized protein n=1 Tax=Halotia branconii CENA392 TaxID=1539056 RepID=A0AAJ6P9N9_9CYAN|nr:hypothetical protein [Halotia branconii]WGV25935.1 hypothetical protein QI031_30235 [Halotia branconii CENA392]WGV25951.1 hypothetical protein QI031_00045 [Halotia branconii CENA392]
MKIQENGKTSEASRGRKKRVSEPQRERLEFVPVQSKVNGIEQIGTGSEDRQRGDTTGAREQGEATSGKVLERLEFIENAYLNYVDDQQQHLEIRLLETKKQKEVFKKAVQELKQEIYDLVSTEATENKE